MSNFDHLDWSHTAEIPLPVKLGARLSASNPYWNERMETLPRAELEAYQTQQLAAVLALAYQKSAYYRETFDTAKVKPGDFENLVLHPL